MPAPRPGLTIVTEQPFGQFFTLTYCARKLGIQYTALHRAMKKGVIPMPRYTDTLGKLLFTYSQMAAIVHTYRAWQMGKIERSEIRPILDEHWNEK